jgi:hypothetical protein
MTEQPISHAPGRTLERRDTGNGRPPAARVGVTTQWPRGVSAGWLRLGRPGGEEIAALRQGRK